MHRQCAIGYVLTLLIGTSFSQTLDDGWRLDIRLNTTLMPQTYLKHGIHEQTLHDGPQPSRASTLVLGYRSNGVHGLACHVQLGLTHVELLCILAGQSVLWRDQHLAQLISGQLLHTSHPHLTTATPLANHVHMIILRPYAGCLLQAYQLALQALHTTTAQSDHIASPKASAGLDRCTMWPNSNFQ